LPGAVETKVRPAVAIASPTYLVELPDVIVGILTTKVPVPLASTDYLLQDWQLAGLRAESCFRAYILTLHRTQTTVIGRLTERDWSEVKIRVHKALAYKGSTEADHTALAGMSMLVCPRAARLSFRLAPTFAEISSRHPSVRLDGLRHLRPFGTIRKQSRGIGLAFRRRLGTKTTRYSQPHLESDRLW
jgi:mRNA interferase MazF